MDSPFVLDNPSGIKWTVLEAKEVDDLKSRI